MKKTLLAILLALATPFFVSAISVPWDRYVVGGLRTFYAGDKVLIGATATSTTANLEVVGTASVSGALNSATLDTGQGANELYDMNQNVLTTSGPTFNSLTLTTALGIGSGGLNAAFTDPNADRLMFWDDSASAITGIATLTGAAISGTTLTINDVTCTDCLGTTEIADSYLLNNGDVGTGNYDFGGATFFEIVNGTGPTANDPGEIAHDTTDNQLVMDDFVFPSTQKLWGATIASTSVDFVSGGRIPMPPLRDGATITEIHCFVDGGTSVVINVDVLANGSPTDTLTCDADGASDTEQSANTSKTALSLNVIEMGTITGSVDYVTFSVWGTWTRE